MYRIWIESIIKGNAERVAKRLQAEREQLGMPTRYIVSEINPWKEET